MNKGTEAAPVLQMWTTRWHKGINKSELIALTGDPSFCCR